MPPKKRKAAGGGSAAKASKVADPAPAVAVSGSDSGDDSSPAKKKARVSDTPAGAPAVAPAPDSPAAGTASPSASASASPAAADAPAADAKKDDDEDDDGYECCICLDKLSLPILTKCKHAFCYLCLKGVAQSAEDNGDEVVCPLCRADIDSELLDKAKVSTAEFEKKHGKNRDDFQWKYSGRSGGWWLFEDRANATLEEGYALWQQAQRDAAIKAAAMGAAVVPAPGAADAAAAAPAAGAAAASPAPPPAAASPPPSAGGKRQSKRHADAKAAADLAAASAAVDATAALHGLPAASAVAPVGASNPHRLLDLVVGGSTYLIDFLSNFQVDKRDSTKKRRICRTRKDEILSEFEKGGKKDTKGQAGVAFLRAKSRDSKV